MEKKNKGLGGIITSLVFIVLLYPFAGIALYGIVYYFLGKNKDAVPALVYYVLPIYLVSSLFLIYNMIKRYDNLEENKHYFCPSCGEVISLDSEDCPHCGVKIEEPVDHSNKPGRKKLPAILFAVFLGGLGIHNYYLKKRKQFFIELALSIISVGLLLPLIHIIALIEAIRIGVGKIKYDGDGNLIC